MTTKIIIVRHGETVGNRLGVLQGWLGGRLTRLGKTQVEKNAELLKGEHASHVFSSDLQRAKDTARAIAKYHSVPVEFVRELREINAGILQGLSFKKARRLHNEVVTAKRQDKYNYRTPSGENYEDVKKRVSKFLDRLKHFRGQTVIIVAHEAVNRVLLQLLLRLSNEETVSISQPHECIYVVERKKGKKQAYKIIKGNKSKGLITTKRKQYKNL
ncbi:MAG: histidine phosphatase family protein [Candidatus Micrarchaeia archaeon]